VNWEKTKVQVLGSREDEPSIVTVQGQEVAVVEEFVYLGSLIHSTTQSCPDISHRNAITWVAMQNINNQIWKSRISISTKLKLYNTYILLIFLCTDISSSIAVCDLKDRRSIAVTYAPILLTRANISVHSRSFCLPYPFLPPLPLHNSSIVTGIC